MVRGVDELEEIVEAVTQKVYRANREDTLDDLLLSWGLDELIRNEVEEYKPFSNGKIVVIGQSEVKPSVLIAIAEEYGIDRNRLELCLDYNEAKRFNYKKLQYAPSYAAVLVGAIPHKSVGAGDYNSAITAMEAGRGYPPVIRLCSNLEMKITKSNFRIALSKLLTDKSCKIFNIA